MKHYSIVLIPGDGIGPEITEAVKRVLAAAGANIEWIERKAGVAAIADGVRKVYVALLALIAPLHSSWRRKRLAPESNEIR